MGAPLLAGEEVIGLLSVQSFEPGVYTPVDLQFLSTLAHHAAVAIQNARLFAEIRSFNDRLERLVAARTEELADANLQLMVEKEHLEELYQISHQLSMTLELDEIVHQGLAPGHVDRQCDPRLDSAPRSGHGRTGIPGIGGPTGPAHHAAAHGLPQGLGLTRLGGARAAGRDGQ